MMKATVSKLGRRLLWPASLLTLAVGAYLIGRGTTASPAQSDLAQGGAGQDSTSQKGFQTTRYANVNVRFQSSVDGKSDLNGGAGWIYGKPGNGTAPAARSVAPAVERRGQSVAGGYYITLPASRYPRAEAHVQHSGKVVITCVEPAGAQRHSHAASTAHESRR